MIVKANTMQSKQTKCAGFYKIWVVYSTHYSLLTMEHRIAYMVVLLNLLIHMTVIGSDNEFYHAAHRSGVLIVLASQAVGYLFYPLLGWLADVYFTRYKFILYSFITMIVTTVISIAMALSVIYVDSTVAKKLSFIAACLCMIVGVIAVGLFESTAIQLVWIRCWRLLLTSSVPSSTGTTGAPILDLLLYTSCQLVCYITTVSAPLN